ncbi:hypothetical protein N781_08050 [Pontibacillus halophilus JSM 076056 = DSM 19796]|uniref:RNA-binding protein n=1 Tax=Pontibacillus halophilus JSM 076056 = DSM 19796 TaxID=1385510 RepID=A0A0A5GB64_9BACI|nr:NYN domain-containing protein [Pontibacillus halophilus]KGX90406.1 hypothetical protein N781_08050 [Pontibacillus halophilus JSM 076056 = DSM 19796]
MEVLIVDGYNIIGAWPELTKLRDTQLSEARDMLIERMAEYQAYLGTRVIVVFDAHYAKGIEKKEKSHRIDVVFTRENETADERIEKLTQEVKDVRTQVYVATSDYTEQRTIFGQGALRKSARELHIEMKNIENQIKEDVEQQSKVQNKPKIPIKKEVLDVFEKWRRGEK